MGAKVEELAAAAVIARWPPWHGFVMEASDDDVRVGAHSDHLQYLPPADACFPFRIDNNMAPPGQGFCPCKLPA